MSGIKFEDLNKFEKKLFNDFKKILSHESWRDLFKKSQNGLYGFEISESRFLRSHIKINILKDLAKTFQTAVIINSESIIVDDAMLRVVIHSFRFGDTRYVEYVEQFLLRYPSDDLIIFITFLLLDQNLKLLDYKMLLHHLQLLMFDIEVHERF